MTGNQTVLIVICVCAVCVWLCSNVSGPLVATCCTKHHSNAQRPLVKTYWILNTHENTHLNERSEIKSVLFLLSVYWLKYHSNKNSTLQPQWKFHKRNEMNTEQTFTMILDNVTNTFVCTERCTVYAVTLYNMYRKHRKPLPYLFHKAFVKRALNWYGRCCRHCRRCRCQSAKCSKCVRANKRQQQQHQ